MLRDTQELNDTSTCWTIVDNKTITNFVDVDTLETYTLVSNTWKKKLTQDNPPATVGTVECYTREQINALPSEWDFVAPIFHAMAIVSAILLFYFAYKLIIHPFFRIKL